MDKFVKKAKTKKSLVSKCDFFLLFFVKTKKKRSADADRGRCGFKEVKGKLDAAIPLLRSSLMRQKHRGEPHGRLRFITGQDHTSHIPHASRAVVFLRSSPRIAPTCVYKTPINSKAYGIFTGTNLECAPRR